MRRRPVEIWWIAAFSLFKAASVFSQSQFLAGYDRTVALGYAGVFVLAAVLLPALTQTGRVAGFMSLGLVCCEQIISAWPPDLQWTAHLSRLGMISFCMWMMVYLQSPSTQRLCSAEARKSSKSYALRFTLLDLMETMFGGAALYGAHRMGLNLWISCVIGLGVFVAYGLFLDSRIRRLANALFARDFGIPANDMDNWRAACNCFVDGDSRAARRCLEMASPEARRNAQVRFFLQMMDWHTLTGFDPSDGQTCLQRAAYDHDWKLDEVDRKRLLNYVECAGDEALRQLVDDRAELIEALVDAGRDAGSFFYAQADRTLARITGETFGFNAPESWAAWWQKNKADWSGDAGSVSLVARLVRFDPPSANALARRIAGRAEEPLLRELTAQITFLNAMHKAIREHGGVEPFIRQPQRMLLVPELTDAVGMLHADSQLLENLGMPLLQVARRLNVRVQLIDYIGKLWTRYPDELSGDMPWLLKTLTGKNFGVLRAKAKFEAWWPGVRESFIRHDRAMAMGLAAHSAGDDVSEEKAFRAALDEQPRGLSARYNLALCVMRRKDHVEAARLLEELIQLEPKEPFWWIVLGVMHRSIDKSSDAHAAFRKALELGAAAPRVALHVGLTFARDRRDAEAIKQLDRALGNNPTPSRIEALVSHLENEGLWGLAGHYREEAFRRGLSRPGDEGNFDPTGGGDEDVAA
jgi:tetratricopeptide (TPR) repeat protein